MRARAVITRRGSCAPASVEDEGAAGGRQRPLVRRTCDLFVSIPQRGRVESLNVSVAAAVLLYEARRQRDG